jgi:serine protease Do
VRFVYPGSPAAQAGIQPGDRIIGINDTKIGSLNDALQALNNVAPGSKLAVHAIRAGSNPLDVTVTAAQLPGGVPAELRPAFDQTPGADPKPAAGETTPLKLAEFPHKATVYVPGTKASSPPLAALLWLATPANGNAADVVADWQSICDREGTVLIVPTAAKADHWEKTDLEYLHRVLQQAIAKYKIDPRRVVVAGQGNAGSIAWPLALASRDLVHGITALGSPLPRNVKVPENEAGQRLAIFAALPPKKDSAAAIAVGLKKVADAGYNIATIITNTSGQLSTPEREELARWIDTLDRF